MGPDTGLHEPAGGNRDHWEMPVTMRHTRALTKPELNVNFPVARAPAGRWPQDLSKLKQPARYAKSLANDGWHKNRKTVGKQIPETKCKIHRNQRTVVGLPGMSHEAVRIDRHSPVNQFTHQACRPIKQRLETVRGKCTALARLPLATRQPGLPRKKQTRPSASSVSLFRPPGSLSALENYLNPVP